MVQRLFYYLPKFVLAAIVVSLEPRRLIGRPVQLMFTAVFFSRTLFFLGSVSKLVAYDVAINLLWPRFSQSELDQSRRLPFALYENNTTSSFTRLPVSCFPFVDAVF